MQEQQFSYESNVPELMDLLISTQRLGEKFLINLPSKTSISVFFSILFACILFFPQVSSASDSEQSLIYNSIAQDSGELFPYLLAANTHRQNPKRLKRKKGKNTHKKYQQSINQKFPEWRSKEEKKSLFKQTTKYGQHLKRNKVLTEGILSHEGGRNGGETVSNHVSVSEKSLISRIEHDLRQKAKAKDKKIDHKELKPELLSSFKSIKEADRLIDRVLADKTNQQKLKDWVKENGVKNTTNSGEQKRLAAYLKHSGNWSSGSLKSTLNRYAKGIKGELSYDGVKMNFVNKKLGIDVIRDNENNYYRVYDMKRKTYLDASGNIPRTGALRGKDAKNFFQEQTHIRNTD